MNRNLEHYILHKKAFIDDNTCDQAVKEMDMIQFQENTFYDPKTKKHITKSGEQELQMGSGNIPTKEIIMNKLWHALYDYTKTMNFPWFNSWSGYTDLRFNKYAENKRMYLHADHIHSMFDGERKGIPILSVVGMLNDDFDGGEFIMFDNMEIEFEKGDLIIFPSNFLYPHKVEPVTKGTRYTYVSWVW